MFRKVLVPLDGSNTAEVVLPYVREIAAAFGSEVILASVVDTSIAGADRLYRYYLERVQENLRKGLAGRNTSGEVKVHAEVLAGRPASEILVYASEKHVNLIAMSNRGRSGLGKWLLGNIAAKVLRATSWPVLLVRAPLGRMAGEEGRLLKQILLPLDGSAAGEAALPYAETLALKLNAEMVLLQVLEPLSDMVSGSDGSASWPAAMYEVEEKRKALALAYLEGVAGGLKKKGLRAYIATAVGTPAEEIITYAEKHASDLIAVSAHGRSGVSRWVFGSVTDKLLHSGHTPIFMVPAQPRMSG
ncbi:MAG: universal stress protein [Chloroflexi bacterium]|nr:universal stress protein [Chloroflexota bacterium]